MDHIEFKAFRKKLNKTQKQLSLLLGVSERTITYYESGKRDISKPTARLLELFIDGNKGKHIQEICASITEYP